MKPGIYHGLSRAEYVAIPAFNQSTLKKWIEFGMTERSPSKFKHWLDTKKDDDSTDAQIEGQILDCLLLEPDLAATKFAIIPEDAPKRPSKAQLNAKSPSLESMKAMQFWEGFNSEAEGKLVVTAAGVERGRKMAEALRRSVWRVNGKQIVMEDILAQYQKTVIVAEMCGRLCKAELDLFAPGTEWIFDIKKTRNAANTERAFGKDAITFGYNIQCPFYMDIATEIGEPRRKFGFLLIEDETLATNAVTLVTGDEVVAWGRKQYRTAIESLAACMESNEWPGYPPFESIQFPQWACMEADAALNHG